MQTRSGRNTTQNSNIKLKVKHTEIQRKIKLIKKEETDKDKLMQQLSNIHKEIYDIDQLTYTKLQQQKIQQNRLFMTLCADKPKTNCDVCIKRQSNNYVPSWKDLPVETRPLGWDDHLNGANRTVIFVCYQCKTPGLMYYGTDENGNSFIRHY